MAVNLGGETAQLLVSLQGVKPPKQANDKPLM